MDATVSPEEGYGIHDPELDLRVPKEVFPPETASELQPGMMFQSQHPNDPTRDIILRIVGMEENVVFVTGNHPLAGQTLQFSVDIVSIRDGSPDEIAQGHVQEVSA